MKRLIQTAAALLILLLPALQSPAADDELLVISMKARPGVMSEKTLRRIYLKRKILWPDDSRIVPVNLPVNNALRTLFTEKIIALPHRDLVAYWNEEYYQGVRPPEVLQSEEAVKIFVRQIEGAIGYIHSENLDPDLKVLYRIRITP